MVGYFITKYGSRRFRSKAGCSASSTAMPRELISGQRTVKAFSCEPQAAQKFGAINQELYSCGYRAQFASALVNPSTRFVNNIAYVLVGVFGIIGGLSAGGIASFLTYTAQFFPSRSTKITAITMQLQLAMASARRVFQVMDEPSSSRMRRMPRYSPRPAGRWISGMCRFPMCRSGRLSAIFSWR